MRISLFLPFLLYSYSIAIGGVSYLTYQTSAPRIFQAYSINGFDLLIFIIIAFIASLLIPKKIIMPSDWFTITLVPSLLVPALTLAAITENISIKNKITLILTLVACFAMIAFVRCIKTKNKSNEKNEQVNKNVIVVAMTAWMPICIALLINYHDVMQFSGIEEIYIQREITGAAREFWGYTQLYFTFIFSTIIIAYGLSGKKWIWVIVGFIGYFIMFLITAERSSLLFPIFFIVINYLAGDNLNIHKKISFILIVVSVLILGVAILGQKYIFFDLIGFYIFVRLIAVPGQFMIDYFNFFYESGYTFFSHIRGFNLIVDAPSLYSSHPKWPQLGWVVGADFHGLYQNSNASFLANDGAASLGATGMLLVTFFLCSYLIIINNMSYKFPIKFWSIIFAQQAFILINGSFFSLLLSFGGIFYLIFFVVYKNSQLLKKSF